MQYLLGPARLSPPHRTHARSQWRQRLRLLHSLALRERHVNVSMERQFVLTLIRLLFQEQADLGLL